MSDPGHLETILMGRQERCGVSTTRQIGDPFNVVEPRQNTTK